MTLASLDTKAVGEILSSIREQMSDPNMGEVAMDEQQTEKPSEDVLVLTQMVEDDGPTQGGAQTQEILQSDGAGGESFAQTVLSPEEMQAIQTAQDKPFDVFDEIGKIKSSPVAQKAPKTPAAIEPTAVQDSSQETFGESSALQGETFTTDATSFESPTVATGGQNLYETTVDFGAQNTAEEEIFSIGEGVKSMVNDTLNNMFNKSSSDEPLVSPETAQESMQAFSELAATLTTIKQHTEKQETFSMDKAGNYTLENLMRELLKPMLKDWLDANLPSIVKWLVTEQIEKMLQAQGLGNIAGKGTTASSGAGTSASFEEATPATDTPSTDGDTPTTSESAA